MLFTIIVVRCGQIPRREIERVGIHAKSLAIGDGKSALGQHQVNSVHRIDSKSLIDQITLLDQGPKDSHRKIPESIDIKLRGAILSRKDVYQLPDLYMAWLAT